MAAAYAALVSLMHIIDQLQHHPRPPISLDESQVESLTEKLTFLLDFLEVHSHGNDTKEADSLESRITDAAYAAEVTIESQIVDQILGETTTPQKSSCINCFPLLKKATSHGSNAAYQDLQKVIADMDFIKKEAMLIKEKMKVQDHLHRNPMPADSLGSSSSTGHNIMVGFDDVLNEVMDKLTGQESTLQIIPIVGMGGIGKTTLARNVYINPLIKEHFYVCAWTTISQEYSIRDIIRDVLCQVNREGWRGSSETSEIELGEMLYKYLSGQRYLIVMDDMWSSEVWDKMKFLFPNCDQGSRIVITTRLSNLALELNDSYWIQMKLLDEDKSWDLLLKTVFGKKYCPFELVKIGKKIAKGCRGLPLSITLIGGLLAKSKNKQEYWEYIVENLNSVVNLEDNERCLKILYMSYKQLPIYLKPCFLYMGAFPEDCVIRVSMLLKLWVAEGFLKPVSGKSSEVVAKKYLKELIDRNLVLVHKLGSTGNIKYCKIHDTLRDLCLREAGKERFCNVKKQHGLNIPHGRITHLCIHYPEWLSPEEKFDDALQPRQFVHSLIWFSQIAPPFLNFKLLRIWKTFEKKLSSGNRYFLENMFHLVNLRYIAVSVERNSKFCSSVRSLWNLQTFIIEHYGVLIAPSEFWKMSQLRHVEFTKLDLPNPCSADHMDGNDIVLENLETLSRIRNLKCSEEIIKRIPNIKKLRVVYDKCEGSSHYCLNNLERLHKLEAFGYCCTRRVAHLLQDVNFPNSLKKLTIDCFYSEDVLQKIGSLPLLEKLKLMRGIFKDPKWETVEGQFCALRFLLIESCINLVCWKTESTHFPCLEHLVLRRLEELKEIPLDIGEIPTLQSIHLVCCSDSAVVSAEKIQEQQEELGNVGLRVLLGEENDPWLPELAKSQLSDGSDIEEIPPPPPPRIPPPPPPPPPMEEILSYFFEEKIGLFLDHNSGNNN